MAGALLFLGFLLASVAFQGWRGFLKSEIYLEIYMDPARIGENGSGNALSYQRLIKKSLRMLFSDVKGRERRDLDSLASLGGGVILRDMTMENPALVGTTISVWLPAGSQADGFFKGADSEDDLRLRRVPDAHIARMKRLQDDERSRTRFNFAFFTASDSRNPEMAGIGSALIGSFFTLLITFLVSFPIGVLAAAYLEMFAPRNRWFDFIEINISNLAAVPSVIFGLLGLAVLINLFGMPRSSPLVGGLVLSLMTLPTIVIASRAALAAVPPSFLEAAMSLGASRMQGVFHYVVPSAMPGILTGSIIGMAQALGETAPLLLIGMVAFIVEAPEGVLDAATALPVQIFLWADSPERGFAERTATAIIVLLMFLTAMNAAAIFIRGKLEKKK